MQIFTNGKRRFYSLIEFYEIHLKNQGEKVDYSTTLNKPITTVETPSALATNYALAFAHAHGKEMICLLYHDVIIAA